MGIKQDRGMLPRTPLDVERRYKLQEIEPIGEEVNKLKDDIVVDSNLSATSTHPVQNKVVTEALSNKVNVTAGKSLSTNDFTDAYKNQLDTLVVPTKTSDLTNDSGFVVDSNYVHTDNNFTNEYKVDVLQNNIAKHTHDNKTTLDDITEDDVTSWNNKSGLTTTTIYNNSSGTIGSFATTISTATYDCIDIVFGDASGRYETKRVYEASGKTISLVVSACSANSYASRTQLFSINGVNFTAGTRHKWVLDSTGELTVTNSGSVEDADKILVYKVIGYKF